MINSILGGHRSSVCQRHSLATAWYKSSVLGVIAPLLAVFCLLFSAHARAQSCKAYYLSKPPYFGQSPRPLFLGSQACAAINQAYRWIVVAIRPSIIGRLSHVRPTRGNRLYGATW